MSDAGDYGDAEYSDIEDLDQDLDDGDLAPEGSDDSGDSHKDGDEDEDEDDDDDDDQPKDEDDEEDAGTLLDEIKEDKTSLAIKTYPSLFTSVLTIYEKTEIIGFRAQQIASGSDIYVASYSDDTPFKIAERELREGKLPYYIDRRLPDGQYASVKLDDLLDVY